MQSALMNSLMLLSKAGNALERILPTRTQGNWSKVPEVTALFWVIKILSTGMGETGADYVDKKFNPIYPVTIAMIILALSLKWQFGKEKFVTATYWFAVVMVSVCGTMVADALHVALGVPYSISTPLFALALSLIFAGWWISEHTLSIHSITSPRREMFYWLTVITTFALGTAAGDLTAVTLHMGYLSSGIMFAALFLIPGVLYKFRGLTEVTAFWTAYIITRPFGASFADWMGVTKVRGGLDWGTGPVTIVLALIICILIWVSARKTPQ